MGLRLLVVAGAAAADATQLPDGVRTLLDAADEVRVVAPRLPGRLEWLSSDTDRATQHADERLQAVLDQMEDLGTPAEGRVGSDEVLQVFRDALQDFDADHLLLALRPLERSGWQERGLLDAVVKQFTLPVTVFELSDAPGG